MAYKFISEADIVTLILKQEIPFLVDRLVKERDAYREVAVELSCGVEREDEEQYVDAKAARAMEKGLTPPRK